MIKNGLVPVLALLALAGCKVKGNTESAERPLALPVLQVTATDTVLQQAYVADIQALQHVEIRAKAPGFIDKILVDEGQTVKKGQLLFSIENSEYQTQLTRAKAVLASAVAEAETAELEMKRVKILVDKNVIAKSEYDLAKAKVAAAAARINEARSQEQDAAIRLSYTDIRSPFDGVIDRIPFKRGSLVSEGNLLTTVSNLDAIYAYFNVSENEYLRYVQHQKAQPDMDDVQLVLADGDIYPHAGKVETMENVFDESTGSIAFRARFPNPGKLLKQGATGKVKLTTKADSVLLIPQKSVFEIQDKNYVFLVGKNNQVKMRNIEPRSRVNDLIIVQSGLKAGETIVYEGLQQVHDGQVIAPKPIAMK